MRPPAFVVFLWILVFLLGTVVGMLVCPAHSP